MKEIGRIKTLIITLTVLISSAGLVIGLHHYSVWNIGYIGGGFTRTFAPAPLLSVKSMDLHFNSFYIAGVSNSHIYLGNHTAPFRLLVVDNSLLDSNQIHLKVDSLLVFPRGSVQLSVDSPDYYILNGIVPFIYKGNLYTHTSIKIPDDSVFFKQAVPIRNNSFIYRSASGKTGQDIIIKKSNMPKNIQVSSEILQKQIDGIFCTDGMLHYSETLSSLVYVYYYRNQYIIADSNLTSIVRGNSIDTTSKAKIKIAEIKSNHSVTMASPPVVVNKYSVVDGKWLFINSGIISDNEDKSYFDSFSVIDVYDLTSQKYRFSFYLPQFEGRHISSFNVLNLKLIVLYDQFLVLYQISPKVFSE